MQHPREYEFIVLAYGLDPTRERSLPVAVVASELRSDIPRKLTLHVAATLQIENKRHLAYLQELFESWVETPIDEADRLFAEIRDLSSGPLVVHRSGFCLVDELPAIVDEALGRFWKIELLFSN